MPYFSEALFNAVQLIAQLDPEVYGIVWISLKISCIATLIASFFGVVLGILAAASDFTGKRLLQHILNALMAMPTVMIGLIFYGLLSRQGPLGEFGLLYTPTAVVIGETCLILPIIMNMAMVAVQTADPRLLPTLKLLGARTDQQLWPILQELRYPMLHAVITGFGRAIGEVGAAMMLGGNIMGSTRTITTAIALETSKGEFELGLALGLILLLLAFLLNLSLQLLKARA
ncbi:MAG: ABC transporter permease [Methylomicrobium sp.]|jgi:ABC-type tungstate transport system, periplasmic component